MKRIASFITIVFASSLVCAQAVRETAVATAAIPYDVAQIDKLKLKSAVPFDSADPAVLRPLLKEIVPCRLVDTLAADAPPFTNGETRTYKVTGLSATNPCALDNRRAVDADALEIPGGIVGAILNIHAVNLSGSSPQSAIFIAGTVPADPALAGYIAKWFGFPDGSSDGIVRTTAGSFTLSLIPGDSAGTQKADADFIVDLLGYFVEDPAIASIGTTGPEGPKGDIGEKGEKGDSVQGPPGPVGNVGAQGATGAAGAVGPSGPKGDSGPAGSSGLDGAAGPAGPVGAPGASGPQGPAGPIGPTGVGGPQGASGPVGPQGPKGDKGDDGGDFPCGGYIGLCVAGSPQDNGNGGNLSLPPCNPGETLVKVQVIPNLCQQPERSKS